MSREAELKRKVGTLVRTKFNGNYRKAFDHYASLKIRDKSVDKKELEKLLKDAGVGTGFTRSMWVKGVMDKLDKNDNGKISLNEFEAVMKGK